MTPIRESSYEYFEQFLNRFTLSEDNLWIMNIYSLILDNASSYTGFENVFVFESEGERETETETDRQRDRDREGGRVSDDNVASKIQEAYKIK